MKFKTEADRIRYEDAKIQTEADINKYPLKFEKEFEPNTKREFAVAV